MNKSILISDFSRIMCDPEYRKIADADQDFRVKYFLFMFYGLKQMRVLDITKYPWVSQYEITDESRFSLFMLKFSECIEKISYE